MSALRWSRIGARRGILLPLEPLELAVAEVDSTSARAGPAIAAPRTVGHAASQLKAMNACALASPLTSCAPLF
jgi:hypothetical protein